jgi:hypothetical protein
MFDASHDEAKAALATALDDFETEVNYPSAAEPTEWASNFVEVC